MGPLHRLADRLRDPAYQQPGSAAPQAILPAGYPSAASYPAPGSPPRVYISQGIPVQTAQQPAAYQQPPVYAQQPPAYSQQPPRVYAQQLPPVYVQQQQPVYQQPYYGPQGSQPGYYWDPKKGKYKKMKHQHNHNGGFVEGLILGEVL